MILPGQAAKNTTQKRRNQGPQCSSPARNDLVLRRSTGTEGKYFVGEGVGVGGACRSSSTTDPGGGHFPPEEEQGQGRND